MERITFWLMILLGISSLWGMLFFALGYPSISMFVNKFMRRGFIYMTMVLPSGTIVRTWVSHKNLLFSYDKKDYSVTEKYLRARHGLWHAGISQQLPWPESSWESLKGGLDSRTATAVYHSKVAEWLNLINSNPKLSLILTLQIISLIIIVIILCIVYQDHRAMSEALNIAKVAANKAGVVV